jgi:hypothetical protein
MRMNKNWGCSSWVWPRWPCLGRAWRAPKINSTRKPRRASIGFEKGPATIDVSKYPQGIQDNYETFSQKCTQCHKLSRPVNCDYVLPDEWSRYVKRMMHKPGSGIDSADGKKIYEFLVPMTPASAKRRCSMTSSPS